MTLEEKIKRILCEGCRHEIDDKEFIVGLCWHFPCYATKRRIEEVKELLREGMGHGS